MRPRRRAGYTLVEVLMSGALVAMVIVPALTMMRHSLQLSQRVSDTNTLENLCVSKLEEHLAKVAVDSTFADGMFSGTFSVEGQPEMRFQVTRTQSAGEGGVSGRLMVIHCIVWHDADGDTAQDTDEAHCTFSSKIAKLASYQGT